MGRREHRIGYVAGVATPRPKSSASAPSAPASSPVTARAKIAHAAQLGFVVVAALVAYAFVATAKDGEQRRTCSATCALAPSYAARARRAPDFELSDLEGQKVRLSSLRGKVVILNFWSRTCPPCLEEMPSLEVLAHKLAGRSDVVLLTINTDESVEEAASALHSILGESPSLRVLVDPGGDEIRRLFGTRLFPETWFIDAEGVIRARVDGARDWAAPIALELVDSLGGPQACDLEFQHGRAVGPSAQLCSELRR